MASVSSAHQIHSGCGAATGAGGGGVGAGVLAGSAGFRLRKGTPGEDEGLVFRLPKEDVEIVVANTLDFVNARYSGPEEKNLPGECEQADTKNALDRWFLERQQEHKRKPR